MLVETFEVLESNPVTGQVESEPEALAIIEKYDLAGQKSLTTNHVETGEKSRIPYRLMTDQEYLIYSTLLGTKEAVTKYNSAAIPLRILQVLAHAMSLEYFTGFWVWYQDDVIVKDPILTATTDASPYTTKHYLLGRWGDVLESLEELEVKAAVAAKNAAVAKYTVEVANAASKKAQIESLTITGGALLTAVKKIDRGY